MKILKLIHQKTDYYVVTITDQTPSEVIFGSIDSLELINGNNSSGALISSFIINKKPLIWIGMCVKETDGCQDYFFELTK